MPVVPKPAARSSRRHGGDRCMNPEDDDRTIIRPPADRDRADSRVAGRRSRRGALRRRRRLRRRCRDQAATAGLTSERLDADDSRAFGHDRRPEPRARPSRRARDSANSRSPRRSAKAASASSTCAWDHSLDRKVALKEYMPASLAIAAGAHRHQAALRAAPRDLRGRPEELHQRSRAAGAVRPSLAGQGLPLLGGERHRLHGDARSYEGVDRCSDARPGDAQPARTRPGSCGLLAPLLDALAVLHAAQMLPPRHRPRQRHLLLADTGRPLLLDFGAARRVIGDMTQALTVILKPGYAPVEQYADMPGMKQGPWTDVYALAAVVHWIDHGQDAAALGRPAVRRPLLCRWRRARPAATATPSCAPSTTPWRSCPRSARPSIEGDADRAVRRCAAGEARRSRRAPACRRGGAGRAALAAASTDPNPHRDPASRADPAGSCRTDRAADAPRRRPGRAGASCRPAGCRSWPAASA